MMLPDVNPETPQDPYLVSLIRQDDQKAIQEPLRASMWYGVDKVPDQQAALQRSAREFGVDPEIIAGHEEEFARASKLNAFDYDAFIKHSPMTAAWFTDPQHSALAHDDLESLLEVEASLGPQLTESKKQAILGDLQAVRSYNASRNEFQSALAAVESGFVNTFGSAAQALSQEGSELYNMAERSMRYVSNPMKRGPSPRLLDPDTGKLFDNPLYWTFGRDAFNQLAATPGMLLAMAVGGKATVPGVALSAGQERFRSAQKEGADPYVAALEGIGSTAINALLMTKMPKLVQRPMAPFTEAATTRIGGLSGMEVGDLRPGAPSGLAVASENLLTGGFKGGTFRGVANVELPLGSQWRQAAIRGGIFGPTMAAAENIIGWAHPEGRKDLDMSEVLQGTAQFLAFESMGPLIQTLNVLDNSRRLVALGRAIETSKLKARDPETFRGLVEDVVKGGENEEIGIPVEHFQEFYAKKGYTPEQIAAQAASLTPQGSLEAYNHALEAGVDLPISTAKFLLLPPEDYHGLMQDVRMRPRVTQGEGVMTTREYVDWAQSSEGKATLANLDEADVGQTRARVLQDASSQKVYERVRSLLVKDVNFNPAVAETYAVLTANAFKRIGQREGMSAEEAFAMHDYKFTRKVPESGVQLSQAPLDDWRSTREALRAFRKSLDELPDKNYKSFENHWLSVWGKDAKNKLKSLAFAGQSGKKALWQIYNQVQLKEMSGAPPQVRTTEDRQAVVDRFTEMAAVGWDGRLWYEESAKAWLEAAGGNRLEAVRMSALAALYSSSDGVASNGAHAIRAYEQAMMGMKIQAGRYPDASRQKAEAILGAKTLPELMAVLRSQKVGTFQQNLIEQIAPEFADSNAATIDTHMMRAAGFEIGIPSTQQYKWVESVVQDVAQLLGCSPKQAQAAIWIAQKMSKEGSAITEAGFHYGNALGRIAGNMTVETIPGKSHRNDIFPGYAANATPEQIQEFHESKIQIAIGALRAVGIPVTGLEQGRGYWDHESNPVNAFKIPLPAGKGGEGTLTLEPAAVKAVHLAAAIVGSVFEDGGTPEQEGIGWNRPFYAGPKDRHNAMSFRFDRALTSGEVLKLGEALADAFGDRVYPDATNPRDIRIISPDEDWAWGSVLGSGTIEERRKAASIWHDQTKKVVENTLPGVDERDIITYHCEGQLVERKDYATELEGSKEGGDQVGGTGRSDILRRVVADWRSKNEALNERFRTEYGWGGQGRVSDRTYGFVRERKALSREGGEASAVATAGRGEGGVSVGPDGVYTTRTKLVETGLRNVGIRRVQGIQTAADAFAHLGSMAVEHFDALVLDKDGTPLAVVGAFKGTHGETQAPIEVITQEVSRVPGASRVWFAHNHPSGSVSLSEPDLHLWLNILNTMLGSGIEPMGFFAIGGGVGEGRNWVFADATGQEYLGSSVLPRGRKNVPILERTFEEHGTIAGLQVTSPREAMRAAESVWDGQSGLLFLDAHGGVLGFKPVDPNGVNRLRETPQMRDLWEGMSVANAMTSVIIQGEDMTDRAAINLSHFLTASNVPPCDIIRRKGDMWSSWGSNGRPFQGETFSEGPRDGVGNRGSITFGEPDANGRREITVSFLENADLSTFLHELTHLHVELLRDSALREGVSEQVRADWQALRKFAGAGEGDDPLTPEQHEIIAKAGEVYFSEGQAPSEALRPIFDRLKAWMLLTYRRIQEELGVQLTPEVREVFDRLYATEEEIEQAHRKVGDDPALFTTPEQARMTPEEFEVYTGLISKGLSQSKNELFTRLQKDADRRREDAWRKEAEGIREEVKAEVDAEPVYAAIDKLSKGDPEDGIKLKLNKQALIERYGEEIAADLPRRFQRIYTLEGGMDPDAAALYLGFSSGDDLIKALREAEPRSTRIDRIAAERQIQRHGDMLTNATMAEGATKALMSDYRAQALHLEFSHLEKAKRETQPLRDLQRKIDEAKTEEERQRAQDAWSALKVQTDQEAQRTSQGTREAMEIPIQAFRFKAQDMVQKKLLRELDPHAYLLASGRNGKAAFNAMAKGDFEKAAAAKKKQLLNHFLYLESMKALKLAEKGRNYCRKFERPRVRERIAKAGGEQGQRVYLDHIDQFLEQIEFKQRSNVELERQDLGAWIKEHEASLVFDESLVRPKNYRSMTINELQASVDAIKNIETLARNAGRVLDGNKQMDKEVAIAELDNAARTNLKVKPPPIDKLTLSGSAKAGSALKNMDIGLQKLERVISWLDGDKPDGPWHRLIFEPLANAQYKEYELQLKVTNALGKAMEMMPEEHRRRMLDQFSIPDLQGRGTPGIVTRKFILSIALNWGNASNREKLVKGMAWADRSEVVGAMLDHLTAEDWQFVQGVWNTLGDLWPEIEALQLRATGVAPPRVPIEKFQVRTGDGQMLMLDGGYYPVVYDRTKSSQGAKQADMDLINSEGGWNAPHTFQGHTISRVNFAAPFETDFEHVLANHLSKVIKDLSHREAAMSVASLLHDQRVRNAIIETLGPEYEKMFMPWLKGTVNDTGTISPDAKGWQKFLMALRGNVVIGGLAFRASSVLVQATDLGRASVLVPPVRLGTALLKFGAHPIELTREVRALSREMASRPHNLDRDLRATWKRLQGKDGFYNRIQKFGLEGLAVADCITSITTWKGAFDDSISRGRTQEQAVLDADRVVRLVCMTGAPKDLVAIQRAGDVGLKLVTMYLSDSVSNYGMMTDAARKVMEGEHLAKSAWTMALVGMILPIVGQLIKQRGPKEDEDNLEWVAKQALFSLPSSVPILRDVSQALQSGRDYQFTPVANAINKAVLAARMSPKVLEGTVEWDDYFLHCVDAMGGVAGLPGAGQFVTTADYLNRVSRGEEEPDITNTIFGKPRK